MSNTHRRRLSANEVKTESELLNNVDVCSLLNQLNAEERFLLCSCKAEENDSVNATNISDEVNDSLISMNIKPKSRRPVDWKELEDSLDCDGDFLGWYRDMRSGQLTDLETLLQQQLFLKAQEEEKQQLESCIALMKNTHERELADSYTEINTLRQENEQLRSALRNTQMEVTRIQSQLDKLKQEFMNQGSAEMKERMPPNPLTGQTTGRRSPLGMTSQLSSRRSENIPGSLIPTQKRILFLGSGLSDSESVLDPLSCEDVTESDRELTQESDQDITVCTLKNTLESLGAESLYGRSALVSKRKVPPGFPIQPADVLLYDSEKSEPTYRLVLAGDAGSGKSSFLLRLSQHQFKETMRTTVGVDCQMKRMLVDGKRMALQIWDTAGQERFHSLSRSYFQRAHGILLLYDITSEKSFLNITQWLEQIEACIATSKPMCLVGNKADLRGQVPSSRCVSSACGTRLATTCGALFFETSAKDGTNIVEAVLHLAREVKKVGGLTVSTVPLSSHGDGGPTAGSCCWGWA